MSLGGGWGLKLYPPPTKFSFKATLPHLAKQNFWKKWHFWRNFWLFWPFFQKILGTSRDYHKSAIKFSKFFWPLPPLKIFLNPYPPPTIFGQAHVCKFKQLIRRINSYILTSSVFCRHKQLAEDKKFSSLQNS